MTAPKLSRRAESLGTENAFVVLAEVNALRAPGQGHRLVLHRPARFPDAAQRAGGGDRRHQGRQARLHAVGGHRRAARRRGAATWARAAASTFAPDDVVVGAGAKPFIAYTIASVTDYGAGDEVIYPVPGFPIYESQIHANGAVPGADLPARVARLRVRPGRARSEDHAADEAPDPQYAAQPDRRACCGRRTSTPSPAILAPPSAGLGVRRRDLFAPRLRRRLRVARAPARGCSSARSSATARRRPGR